MKGVIAAEGGEDVRFYKLLQADVALFLLLRLPSKGRLNLAFKFFTDYLFMALVLFSWGTIKSYLMMMSIEICFLKRSRRYGAA